MTNIKPNVAFNLLDNNNKELFKKIFEVELNQAIVKVAAEAGQKKIKSNSPPISKRTSGLVIKLLRYFFFLAFFFVAFFFVTFFFATFFFATFFFAAFLAIILSPPFG